ncbi:MAG: ABC transporter ATP-binding protein [Planctomycetaceae bacterium]|nr:ABC transporter ATP-binding protein [Planctomycetaceae bacterium]
MNDANGSGNWAIETRKLTKHYGRQCVVNQLNLRVPTGGVYGLLGRNGAGKSTSIKMLMGLVRPDYGTAVMLGEDVSELKPETRGRIAYLAEGHPLYPWMTVKQCVDFCSPFYPKWNGRMVEQVLDHFALSSKKKVKHLSRGQRGQLALTLAVAPDPDLLILDDPTLGLDPTVRRDFLDSIVQIIQRPGRTILFSSHILPDVERVADRIGVMLDGVLRVDCPTEVFKASVVKVVCEFEGTVPQMPTPAGLLQKRQLGKKVELAFVRYGDEQRKELERLQPKKIEEVSLSLEDAFIEYTREARRPLNLFSGEELPEEVADGALVGS